MSARAVQNAFERIAQRYIRHQRALGLHFDRQAWVIGRLAKYLKHVGAPDLDATQFDAWCASRATVSANERRSAAFIVHKFCRYRRRIEPECFVPDPMRFARRAPYRSPVIFGPREVARILHAVAALPVNTQFPLRSPVLRLAVILLYTAGLRRGELVHLKLSDLDLTSGTIRIRESKFHKSRILPLSVSAQAALCIYLRARLAPPWDICADAPLLGHHHGTLVFKPYSDGALGKLLRDLLQAARVCDTYGRPAHVHDFRHTFAVQALLRWYRQGTDVQSKLPQLSMYMGHASILSTAYYLHFTPAVARAASRRFGREFGHLVGGAS